MKLANTGEADDVVVARAVGVPRVTAIEEECLLGVAAIVAQFDKFVKFDNVVEGGEGEGEGEEGEEENYLVFFPFFHFFLFFSITCIAIIDEFFHLYYYHHKLQPYLVSFYYEMWRVT